jgi:hypothetical protein
MLKIAAAERAWYSMAQREHAALISLSPNVAPSSSNFAQSHPKVSLPQKWRERAKPIMEMLGHTGLRSSQFVLHLASTLIDSANGVPMT